MKNTSIIIILVISQLCFSQKKDTIYILFDDQHPTMEKSSFKTGRILKEGDKSPETSFTYRIDEKETENPFGYSTGYTFSHFNQLKSAYTIFGGRPPLKMVKDSSFLNEIKPLDNEFFRKTTYRKVCKTFEEEDSWEQDVVIFVIDIDEICHGNIILREVNFGRPVKE